MAIHPTAIVEDGATLGAGVEIGPFCIVERTAVLGDGVRLLSHAIVKGHTTVGARTVLHPQVVLGGEGQIRRNTYTEGRLVVGADCVLREGVTMSVGSRNGGGLTTVGDNGYFMAMTHVGHDCHVGDDVTFANGAVLGGHCEVGQGVILGGMAAVQQFVRIGRGAMMSGLSGAPRDIIPYGMAIGLHATIGGLNIIGLKRRGLPRATIHALRHAFKTIFLTPGGSLLDRARAAKEAGTAVPEVRELVDFVLVDSKQGIAPADPSRIRTDED